MKNSKFTIIVQHNHNLLAYYLQSMMYIYFFCYKLKIIICNRGIHHEV